MVIITALILYLDIGVFGFMTFTLRFVFSVFALHRYYFRIRSVDGPFCKLGLEWLSSEVVCLCVRACVRACVWACVRACERAYLHVNVHKHRKFESRDSWAGLINYFHKLYAFIYFTKYLFL